MNKIVFLLPFLLSGCVAAGDAIRKLELVPVESAQSCSVLYGYGKPLIRKGSKGPYVYAGGEKCPPYLDETKKVLVLRVESLTVGNGGHAAKAVFPTAKDGTKWRIAISEPPRGYGYRYGATKQ